MSRISDEEVDLLADAIEMAMGGASKVRRESYHVQPGRKVGMAYADEFPRTGLSTACTLGLAHESWTAVGFKDRTELVMASAVGTDGVRKTGFVVAREIVREHVLPKPGRIFAAAALAAGTSFATRMPHALIVAPHLWQPGFDVVRLPTTTVWFVQVVPIFDSEMQYITNHGFVSFEALLQEDGVRFWDERRGPHA